MAVRNLLNLEQVSKSFGVRMLLDAVSLGVAESERVGVVGRNGDGKTTLLRLMTGAEPPDSGRVTLATGLRLGVLGQGDDLPPGQTVADVVVGRRAEHEWAGDARVRSVLHGLFGGVEAPLLRGGLRTPVGGLSGGERRRVALARVLVGEHDLVVLDEPTNHLDVEGVAWLAGHLRGSTTALVVVTHDRWFLDEVCEATWEVAGGAVHPYEGGYSAYVLARAERARVAAAEEARRQNLLRKELAWLRRGPPARTSKPRFRIEAANALIADEPPPRDSLQLARSASARLGRTVYDLEDVTLDVGGRALLENVTWSIGPGDRVGVVGVNGAGKTSLLRLLVGELAPSSGRVARGVTVRPAHLSQHVTEVDPSLRVLEAVESVRSVVDLGGGQSATASQMAERFGFRRERQWTRVGDLSGGERRRLQLLRLLMDEPNVLLLDEPTNDLDIDTLTALEDLLDGWAGTLVVVSHDRYVLDRVCDRTVALLGDGTVRDLPRGVEEYLELRASQATGPGSDTPSEAGRRRPDEPSAADVRQARKDLVRIERRLDRLAAEEAQVHERLAAVATDFEQVAGLDARLRELVEERERLEEEWLAVAEGVPAG